MSRWPGSTGYVIAPNTYPGQGKPVHTIAQPNFLAVRADVPEEDVYKILRTMYGNLSFLHTIHPITKGMDMSRAITGGKLSPNNPAR